MGRQIRNSRRGRRTGSRKGTRKGTRKGMRAGSRKGKKTYKRRRNSRRQIGGDGWTVSHLKTILDDRTFKTLKKEGGIVLARGAGHGAGIWGMMKTVMTKFQVYKDGRALLDLMKKHINFDISQLSGHKYLTYIDLHDTGVTGHIENMLPPNTFKQLTYLNLSNNLGVEGEINKLRHVPSLTEIHLGGTHFTGDIKDLGWGQYALKKLTKINLNDTAVRGDIGSLNSLPILTKINLNDTGVWGDIAHLKSLPKLTYIGLGNTKVMGNIEDLASLRNLTGINLDDTKVTGDKEAFKETLF